MGFTFGQRDRKRRSSTVVALCPYAAAIQLDQFLHEREPNARTFMRPSLRTFHAVKTLEQMCHFLRRYSDASVADAHFHAFGLLFERDFNLAFKCELESIREQVEDDFFPHLAVNVDRLRQ